jgi:hypothetical protein
MGKKWLGCTAKGKVVRAAAPKSSPPRGGVDWLPGVSTFSRFIA